MRILHTMLNVGDMDRSIKFYSEVLGMNLLRRTDSPDGKSCIAFVGYGSFEDSATIELVSNKGVDKYDLGNAYGHIGIGVADAYTACEDVKKRGGKVVREPEPMRRGAVVIAFVEDPDGYKIEFVQLKK
jgi:lactoylglutathione lyase